MTDEERDALLLKLDEKMDKTIDNTTKIHSVLFDTNGNKGLCSKVDEQGKTVDEQGKTINKILIALAFIAGSTGIGFGIVGWIN